MAETAAQIGDPQVRHRGTIGGSVAHADPASDLPTVLLALDAQMIARGSNGERTIAAAEFFRGFLESALGPAEILTEIRVPKLDGPGTYLKYNRRAQDWATVGVAAVRGNGSTSVALTNMAATPVRAAGWRKRSRAAPARPRPQGALPRERHRQVTRMGAANTARIWPRS